MEMTYRQASAISAPSTQTDMEFLSNNPQDSCAHCNSRSYFLALCLPRWLKIKRNVKPTKCKGRGEGVCRVCGKRQMDDPLKDKFVIRFRFMSEASKSPQRECIVGTLITNSLGMSSQNVGVPIQILRMHRYDISSRCWAIYILGFWGVTKGNQKTASGRKLLQVNQGLRICLYRD